MYSLVMTPPLILASCSPRRQTLLTQLGLTFEVVPAAVDETPLPGEAPPALAERLAAAKARAVAGAYPHAAVLGGDTVVSLDGRLFGKPETSIEAEAMLRALAGRTHTVVTAMALAMPGGALSYVHESAAVTMLAADSVRIAAYVATGDSMDKAGAYGIQGAGAQLIARVEGEISTVVGLPLRATVRLLREAGFKIHEVGEIDT